MEHYISVGPEELRCPLMVGVQTRLLAMLEPQELGQKHEFQLRWLKLVKEHQQNWLLNILDTERLFGRLSKPAATSKLRYLKLLLPLIVDLRVLPQAFSAFAKHGDIRKLNFSRAVNKAEVADRIAASWGVETSWANCYACVGSNQTSRRFKELYY